MNLLGLFSNITALSQFIHEQGLGHWVSRETVWCVWELCYKNPSEKNKLQVDENISWWATLSVFFFFIANVSDWYRVYWLNPLVRLLILKSFSFQLLVWSLDHSWINPAADPTLISDTKYFMQPLKINCICKIHSSLHKYAWTVIKFLCKSHNGLPLKRYTDSFYFSQSNNFQPDPTEQWLNGAMR